MSGAYSTTPGVALNIILGIAPLHLEIIKSATQYWIKKKKLIRATETLGFFADTKENIEEAIITKWQNLWETSSKSRRLFGIINNVNNRLKWEQWNPGRGAVHFLSGHGPYRAKLFELGMTETPLCECGAISTPEHVVLECPRSGENIDGTVDRQINNLRQQLQNLTVKNMIEDENLRNTLDQLATRISHIEKMKFLNRN